MQGDVAEAQKHIPFARSKAPVAHKYRNAFGASSFKKVYTREGATITVQGLGDATTIFIDAPPVLDIYIQDDTDYYEILSPYGLYYTTNIWKVKSLPKSPTDNVTVENIITEEKLPGKWNDELSNAEVSIDCYHGQKIDLKYPNFFFDVATYTAGANYHKGELVASTDEYRFYQSDGTTLLGINTRISNSFKYQPVSSKGFAYYQNVSSSSHQYPIIYTELDEYNSDSTVAPRGIIPFVIGVPGYKQWWSGVRNFHSVGIHMDGRLYYTASRYDGSNVTYILQSINIKTDPDSPTDTQTHVTLVSPHPTGFTETDHIYEDSIEIVDSVLSGDKKNLYGYISCHIESATVYSDSGGVNSVNDPLIRIHLGDSWDSMVEIATWNGSSHHGLIGDHMTNTFDFVAVTDELLYVAASTREWDGGINDYRAVLVIEKIEGVWTVTPMEGSYVLVRPIDKEWAIIPTTAYSQFYNFKTKTYHDMYDEVGNLVLIGSNTNGVITTDPEYKAVKRV